VANHRAAARDLIRGGKGCDPSDRALGGNMEGRVETAGKPGQVTDSAREQGKAVAGSRGLEVFARVGLVARGLVYGIVGILALKLALGDAGGKTTSQQGALKEIARQPFGEFLLIATAVGLASYAIWRLVRAAVGHGRETEDSAVSRIGGVVSGIAYGSLCVAAIQILMDSGTGSASADQPTGGVLDWPGGTWIVGIAGLIVIGEGLHQGYKGVSHDFLEKSKTEQMSPKVKRAFTGLGVFGYLARMVVFILIGYFLVKAALDYNPKQAVSLDGALGTLAHAPLGPLVLGVVAAGLIGFGLYSLADARYRKV